MMPTAAVLIMSIFSKHSHIFVFIAAHNKSAAQVLLKWVVSQGHAVVTSSVNKDYMIEDLALWGWDLSKPELAALTTITGAPDDPVKGMCLL